MYLSKLEIQGFKSFANKTSLDFRRGITAIVGPNGSGKSNVADAIRWVLGEQSLKLLRGKKSEDVIFAGSDKKSRLGVAEVSLYLNNEDHSASVDYSEFIISRRVFRDGQGEYLINHQPARLQDIQLLLAQANFGQRTYSVIGQGMIDSFLLSSPQERKHLFDEAAGVRQYQMKKDQALAKLVQTKENVAQGEAIMVEIEPRLRSLTRQVKRLERREEIEQGLRQKQTLYYGLLWQGVVTELAELRRQHDTTDGQRQSVAKELAIIQAELESIERERSASEIFSGLQKDYNRVLDEKNRLLEQQAALQGKLESSGRQSGQAETVFWQRRQQEVQRNVAETTDERNLVEQQRVRKQKELGRAEGEAATKEKEFQALESESRAMEQQWQKTYTLPQAKEAVTAFFGRYRGFVQRLAENGATELGEIRTQAKSLESELASVVKHLDSATADTDPAALSKLQQRLVATANERQAALETVSQLRSEVRLDEQRLAQLDERLVTLAKEQTAITKEVDGQKLSASNPEAAYASFVQEAKDIERQVTDADNRLKAAREQINSFNTKETTKKERLFSLQKDFRDIQHRLNVSQAAVSDLQVKIAKVEQRHEDLQREITQAMSPESVDQIAKTGKEKLDGDVAILAEEIGHAQHQLQLIGGIDDQVTQEYQETNERWEFLRGQADDLTAAIGSLEKAIDELDGVIKERFDAAFRKINDEFNTYFRTLFRGGRAELVLLREVIVAQEPGEDEDDEAEVEVSAPSTKQEKVVTGIEIKATPPGKKLQNITMLSGGERALTSIALLCAIISNNPSPFVALDEVDAALDEANSQRFSAILDQLAHKTQFITITHNRATMEKAGILYGVTMGDDGVSQLLSVKMEQAEEIIRQHGNR